MNPAVKEISIKIPIKSTGKIFTGDYSKSPEYVAEVQQWMNNKSIPFFPNRAMGVYYDNPQNMKPEEMKSFQGVFLRNEETILEKPFLEMQLSGNYLYTKVAGKVPKSIYDGYTALFDYIHKNNITLKSPAGCQVATLENGVIVTEIYMQTI